MTRCNRPGCGGELSGSGFCRKCRRRPLPVADASSPDDAAADEPAARETPTAAAGRSLPWWGLDLVTIHHPAKAGGAPLVQSDPRTPDDLKYCTGCGEPVGQPVGDRSGRAKGYCQGCGTAYDFTPRAAGAAIDGRYKIVGALGFGASGWAYLADDPLLKTRVVLKAVSAAQAAETVVEERDVLTRLRHDNIVRILNRTTEGPYLVLEYEGGSELSVEDSDPLEVLLAFGLQVAQALDYLHTRGLLHCDVKPANIIRVREQGVLREREQVRLIDFGAVRAITTQGPIRSHTPRYAPPPGDPELKRPTEGFDVYCLAKTLAVLCAPHLSRRPPAAGADSLRRLLDRAMATEHETRFRTVAAFAEQLSGVIRELVAGRPGGQRVSRVSAVFDELAGGLDGGLGAARPLEHWTSAELTGSRELRVPAPFEPPTPGAAAATLPGVLVDTVLVDTVLVDTAGPITLDGADRARLRDCLAAVRRGDPSAADAELAKAVMPPHDWRWSWYRGLIALARGSSADVTAARKHFTAVRAAVPGELIPRLALGLCAELGADGATGAAEARAHYEAVAAVDVGLAPALFGLARICFATGPRRAAVAVVEQLAQHAQHGRAAQVAAIRLLAAPGGAELPSGADVDRARALLDTLGPDPQTRASLRAEIACAEFTRAGGLTGRPDGWRAVAAAALPWVRAGRDDAARAERDGFAQAIRALRVAHERSAPESVQRRLVDLAHKVEPALGWSW